jgi:hypothetical protein
MKTRRIGMAVIMVALVLASSLLTPRPAAAQTVRQVWYNGRTYYVDVLTCGQSATVWFRVRANACSSGDIKVATMQAATRTRSSVMQTICRYKDYYGTGKGVVGCVSTVGAGVCIYATAQSGGTLGAVCYTTIVYGANKGLADCLDLASSSIADYLGYGQAWATVRTTVYISAGQWSQAIDSAIDVACKDVRNR